MKQRFEVEIVCECGQAISFVGTRGNGQALERSQDTATDLIENVGMVCGSIYSVFASTSEE